MPDNNRRTLGAVFGMNTRDLLCNPHPLVVGVDRVGVEIELENLSDLSTRNSRLIHWDVITDDSLRNNGREFITKGDGIGGDVLANAAVEVEDLLKDYSPDPTWRCSTHMHLDVRDLTVEEMKRLLIAYIFFEKFLFRESGWARYKSNFCVPIGLAQSQVSILSDAFMIDTPESFAEHISCNWGKYTALNLRPCTHLGTFEFRMPQPTFKAMDLLKVANRFLSLKKVAREYTGDLLGFPDYLDTLTIEDVFPKSLGRNSVFLEEDKVFGYSLAKDLLALRALRDKTNSLVSSGPMFF
jgi:hypothetical protein